LDSRETAIFIAQVADDRKADDIKVLDISKLTLVADYFVICSAQSTTRVGAIAETIVERCKEKGLKALHREGYRGLRWVLIDMGAVVVHVFQEEERKFYDLERLWGDAEVVDVPLEQQ
jgi:ribosome-associated protein